jgi:hypothetical protein
LRACSGGKGREEGRREGREGNEGGKEGLGGVFKFLKPEIFFIRSK